MRNYPFTTKHELQPDGSHVVQDSDSDAKTEAEIPGSDGTYPKSVFLMDKTWKHDWTESISEQFSERVCIM